MYKLHILYERSENIKHDESIIRMEKLREKSEEMLERSNKMLEHSNKMLEHSNKKRKEESETTKPRYIVIEEERKRRRERRNAILETITIIFGLMALVINIYLYFFM